MALHAVHHYGPSPPAFRPNSSSAAAAAAFDSLPKDPRHWSREHVAHWLDFVMVQHGLPTVPASRFLMNGKALCLMTPSMFLDRVPLGGKLLYKDFQLRLCAALYNQ